MLFSIIQWRCSFVGKIVKVTQFTMSTWTYHTVTDRINEFLKEIKDNFISLNPVMVREGEVCIFVTYYADDDFS